MSLSPNATGISSVRHDYLRMEHITTLSRVLAQAYDLTSLRQMIQISFDRPLDSFVPVEGRTTPEIVLKLVECAADDDSIGVKRLLDLALDWNPQNSELRQLQAEWANLIFDLPPICPYVGMKEFSEKESDCFWGRDNDIDAALRKLRRWPFLAVIGSSGSGKSSLVFAGIVPAMQRSSFFKLGKRDTKVLRPSGLPLRALAQLCDLSEVTPSAILSRVRELCSNAPLLIVIDGFEAVFSGEDKAESRLFQETLAQIISLPNLYMILTVRADFYSDLMNSPLWEQVQDHDLTITSLRGKELRAAIAKPADVARVVVEPALLERIIADAGDEPGILPFVQETMVLLWDGLRGGKRLALEAYERLANGSTELSGLQVAMAERAEGTFDALKTFGDQLGARGHHRTSEGQQLAQRIFLRLVQFGEGKPNTRRQQAEDALRSSGDNPVLFDAVLTHLIEHRLLTASSDQPEVIRLVDVAHDALFTGWPRLAKWLDEQREAEQTRRRLEAKTAEWIHFGRGQAGLLDELQLREAEIWRSSFYAQELGISNDFEKLLEQSALKLEQEKQDAANLIQREIDHANELAARQLELANTQSAANEKLGRRNKLLSAALAAALMLLVLAGVFYYRMSQAIQETEVAVARQEQALREREKALEERASALEDKRVADEDRLKAEFLVVKKQNEADQSRALAEQRDRISWSASYALAAQDLLKNGDVGDTSLILAQDAVSSTYNVDGSVLSIADATLSEAINASAWEATIPSNQSASSVFFMPDGKSIAAWFDESLKWFDLSGNELRTMELDTSVSSVDFSPDGAYMAFGLEDGSVRIVDHSNQETVNAFSAHVGPIAHLTFCRDGKLLGTGSSRGENSSGSQARVWDLESGEMLLDFVGVADTITDLAFTPDCRIFAASSYDYKTRVWDLSDGHELLVVNGTSVDFSSDSTKMIVAGGFSEDIDIYDVGSWQLVQALAARGENAEFFADDKLVITDYSTKAVSPPQYALQIWDAASGAVIRTLHGHNDYVTKYTVSPTGDFAVSASSDNTVRIWNIARSLNTGKLPVSGGYAYSTQFANDGKALIVRSTDTHIDVWDLASWRKIQTLGEGTPAFAYNNASNELYAAAADLPQSSGIQVLQVTPDGLVQKRVLAQGPGAQYIGFSDTIAVSPDGKTLASMSGHDVIVWDVELDKLKYDIRVDEDPARTTLFAVSPKHLATWTIDMPSEQKAVRIWDLSTREFCSPDLRGVFARSMAFSPDGTFLAIGGDARGTDGAFVTLWKPKNCELIRSFGGHSNEVIAVSFSPDGTLLASGGYDKTVRVFDTNTGKPVRIITGLPYAAISLSFSQNGKQLAVGTEGLVTFVAPTIEQALVDAQERVQRDDAVLTTEEMQSLNLLP